MTETVWKWYADRVGAGFGWARAGRGRGAGIVEQRAIFLIMNPPKTGRVYTAAEWCTKPRLPAKLRRATPGRSSMPDASSWTHSRLCRVSGHLLLHVKARAAREAARMKMEPGRLRAGSDRDRDQVLGRNPPQRRSGAEGLDGGRLRPRPRPGAPRGPDRRDADLGQPCRYSTRSPRCSRAGRCPTRPNSR
jgi:hypothetical protein